jgi:hypothetical protein
LVKVFVYHHKLGNIDFNCTLCGKEEHGQHRNTLIGVALRYRIVAAPGERGRHERTESLVD